MALQGLYNGHDVALYNYLADLVPVVNERLQEGMRRGSLTRRYDWMYRLVSWKDSSGQFRPRWLDSGIMRPLPKRIETQGYQNTEIPSSVSSYVEMEFYGDQLPVTMEYLQYADNKTQLTENLAYWTDQYSLSALLRHRTLIGNMFLDAFAGSAHTTWEGKALCDEDHSFQVGGQNYSNVKHSPLSADAIEEVEADMGIWVDANDHAHEIIFDTLVVSKKNQNEAMRISKSLGRVGTDLNDINVLRGKYDVVVLPDLHDTIVSTASDWWFLMDSTMHTLTMFIGQDAQIRLVGNPQNDDVAYRQSMHCVAGWYGPVGVVGSDGQGS